LLEACKLAHIRLFNLLAAIAKTNATPDDECTCDTATAAGVDIPGLGGEVCDVCRRQAENKEIPY